MKISTTLIIAILFAINHIHAQEKKDITLEDIWTIYTFYPKSIDGLRSMNDGENYTQINLARDIDKYSFKKGVKVGTIFSLKEIPEDCKIKKISDYEFNADETKILISTDIEQIYRHSFSASFYVWDIKNMEMTPLSEKGKQMLATFSPDGTKVAYARDNNIFYYDLEKKIEIQVTTDGKINEIINGVPDWVYEEEFSFSKAFEWSTDGKKIAYIKFNESRVKEFNLTMYENLYPTWYKYKYPKAGEDNSIVSVHIYNVENSKTLAVDIGTETNIYIPRIKWTNDADKLSIQRLNRLQNKFEILLADALTGKTNVLYTETNKCYVEISDNLTFLNDNKHFIITSEKNGYNHIYLYDMTGKEIRQITTGNWEVTEFLGDDEKNKLFYYMSTELSPTQRDMFSIAYDGTNKIKLTQKPGVNRVEFSKGFKYFVNYYSNANTPSSVVLYDSKGKQKRVLEDNADLNAKMKDYKFSKKEFFKFKTSENIELNGWMIKPYNFDETKKYPVFMTVYGGPGRQTVMDRWEYTALWHQHIANLGYIVVSVDNRGTDGKGSEFRRSTYEQMGKLETIDQIEAAKYLGALDYVDANRIGIQGWSYGGYLSTLCITKGNEFFKMAIAVAPVTNWRYYDSAYIERYMGLPQDNADGYDENSPINYVKKLKGKYLLIHGSADDNVHFQNTVELVDALVQADKQFDLMFYPNSNHGIYTGRNTRYHLFTKMTEYIKDNL